MHLIVCIQITKFIQIFLFFNLFISHNFLKYMCALKASIPVHIIFYAYFSTQCTHYFYLTAVPCVKWISVMEENEYEALHK